MVVGPIPRTRFAAMPSAVPRLAEPPRAGLHPHTRPYVGDPDAFGAADIGVVPHATAVAPRLDDPLLVPGAGEVVQLLARFVDVRLAE